jgi:hypothetical protein
MAKTVPVFKFLLNQGVKRGTPGMIRFDASSWGHHNGHMPRISADFTSL